MSTHPKVCFDRYLPALEYSSRPRIVRIALLKAKIFTPGTELRWEFSRNSTPQQRKAAQEAAERVAAHAPGIKFKFGGGNGDVRVSFDPRQGAWSYTGVDIFSIDSSQPTMNLGFLDGGTAEHETCHTLGAIHEHQAPDHGIKWNVAAVRADLGGPPNNWDLRTIEHNMFNQYSRSQVNGSQFDPKSIMLYAIPKRWTLDGFHTEPNDELSELDKEWLRKSYPGSGEPAIRGELKVHDLRPFIDGIGHPGERDVFVLHVPAPGGLLKIRKQGETDVVLRLFGPDGSLLVENDDVGLQDDVTVEAHVGVGAHELQVSHATTTGMGPYSLVATLGETPVGVSAVRLSPGLYRVE